MLSLDAGEKSILWGVMEIQKRAKLALSSSSLISKGKDHWPNKIFTFRIDLLKLIQGFESP
jgi:hypothetical protein